VSNELRGLSRAGRFTFGHAAKSYLASPRLADTTRRRIRSELRSMEDLAALRLAELRRDVITKHLAKRAGDVGASSVRKEWDTINAIVSHAIDLGWLDGRPWGSWRQKLAPGVPRL